MKMTTECTIVDYAREGETSEEVRPIGSLSSRERATARIGFMIFSVRSTLTRIRLRLLKGCLRLLIRLALALDSEIYGRCPRTKMQLERSEWGALFTTPNTSREET